MNQEDGAKVFEVWSKENSINLPNKKELITEVVDQVASFFAGGNFYYFILNFEGITMDYVSEGVQNVLGIEPSQFSMEKGFEIMHPEDLAYMNEKEAVVFDFFFNKITAEEVFHYKSVYIMRMRHTDGSYKTLLHQASVFSVSDDGKIQQTFCVHTDITYLNIPINHTISFISSKKQSYHYAKKLGNYAVVHERDAALQKKSFKDIFSNREKEIIEKLGQGLNFNEIAKELFISPNTINTHKKNMLKKAECKNTPELIARYYIDSLL
jgi:DNA-binding CsgD family transcriptional regulator